MKLRSRRAMLGAMSAEPHHRIDLLEERMKTHQARYEAALERIERKISDRDEQQLLAMAAIVGLATAILGVLIGVLAVS